MIRISFASDCTVFLTSIFNVFI